MRKVFLLLLCLFPHSMVVYLTKQLFLFLFRRESEWNNLHFMILLWKLFPTFPSFCDVVHCEILLPFSSFTQLLSDCLYLLFIRRCSLRDEKFIFQEKSQKSFFFFPFEMKKTSCISLGEEISSIYPSKVHSTFFYIYSLLANRE